MKKLRAKPIKDKSIKDKSIKPVSQAISRREEYGSFEAKTQLSKILKQVEQGQHVRICRHGKVVAKVVPPQDVSADSSPRHVDDVIAAIFALQKEVAQTSQVKVSIRELRDWGRK